MTFLLPKDHPKKLSDHYTQGKNQSKEGPIFAYFFLLVLLFDSSFGFEKEYLKKINRRLKILGLSSVCNRRRTRIEIIILISNTIKVPSNNASLSNLLCQVFLQCGPTTTNCFHLQQIVLSTTFSF